MYVCMYVCMYVYIRGKIKVIPMVYEYKNIKKSRYSKDAFIYV